MTVQRPRSGCALCDTGRAYDTLMGVEDGIEYRRCSGCKKWSIGAGGTMLLDALDEPGGMERVMETARRLDREAADG